MKRQIIFSFASQALLGFAGLVFVSAFVSAYGKEQYALFSIFLAVASSVQNLDGLQMPLVAKLSQLTSNREKIAQMMQSATLFSTVIGCTGAIIAAVALSIALPDYFLQWRLWLVFIGVGIFIINHFSLSAHRAYLITKERSSVIHISKAFSYIALFVCAFTIMSVRREVYLASAAFPIAAIINSIILNKSIGLQISANKDFSEAFKRHRKDFINGLWFNASVFLFMIIDKIFIGQEGAMKAADYMIPYELFQRLALVHTVIGTVLLGKIATSINREKNNKAISEYSMLYLNTIFFVLIIYMNMIMYGQDFLEIWLKDAVNPTLINNYYLLSTAFFLNIFGWLGINLLISCGLFRYVSIIYTGLPLILLSGIILWKQQYGVTGIAMAVVMARFTDILLFIAGNKMGGLSITHYLLRIKEVWKMWLVSISVILICWTFITNNISLIIVRLILGTTVAFTVLLYGYTKRNIKPIL